MQCESLEVFLARKPKHPPWLAFPWLPRRGLAVIGAPAKVGKTTFVLNVAYRLAGGVAVLGGRQPPMRVLYVDRECGEYAIQARLASIHLAAGEYDATQNLFVQCRSRAPLGLMAESPGLRNLRALVGSHAPQVLILDPLRDCFHGDENDSSVLTGVFQELFGLVDEFGCAAVLVHHTGKPGGEFPYDPSSPYALRGSSRLFDVGDSYLMLRKQGDYGVQVHFTLRHSVHRPLRFAWAHDDFFMREVERAQPENSAAGRVDAV